MDCTERMLIDVPEKCGDENEVSSSTLSKSQLKKLRKKEKWEQLKVLKRAKEKEKIKKRKLDACLNKVKLGPSRKMLKSSTMARSSCKINVAIDLSFEKYMSDKDTSKCIKQVSRCYSINRRAENPLQLHLTSFTGNIREHMSKNSGYENWDIHFHSESYLDVFKREDIIYLSSESENIMSDLSSEQIYVIGGLVDHNAHKGLTVKLAKENNVQHCQLPITEYVNMKTRKVLTIDHVFDILVRVSEGKSWKEAFLLVLPPRKGAIEKSDSNMTNESAVTDTENVTESF